jgi:cytochrome c-type biogenesis protein CcmH
MMMPKRYGFAIGLSLIFGLFVVGVVNAQQAQPTPSDDQVNAIARQLYCPVCENTPLDVCPTTACAQWRDLIRQKLAAGNSEAEIKAYFVEQYGARVLGAPPPEGINWLAYVVPPVIIIAGVYVLLRAFHSWKRPALPVDSQAASPSSPAPLDPAKEEYIKRLEDEVRKG